MMKMGVIFYAVGTNAVVSNCLIVGCQALNGGGVRYSTLNNCILSRNSAQSSGGGSYYGTLYNCTLTGNSASNALALDAISDTMKILI